MEQLSDSKEFPVTVMLSISNPDSLSNRFYVVVTFNYRASLNLMHLQMLWTLKYYKGKFKARILCTL
jgi:hypothetical protein